MAPSWYVDGKVLHCCPQITCGSSASTFQPLSTLPYPYPFTQLALTLGGGRTRAGVWPPHAIKNNVDYTAPTTPATPSKLFSSPVIVPPHGKDSKTMSPYTIMNVLVSEAYPLHLSNPFDEALVSLWQPHSQSRAESFLNPYKTRPPRVYVSFCAAFTIPRKAGH